MLRTSPSVILAVVLAGAVAAPSLADARPRRGGGQRGTASRPRVRDHRGAPSRPPRTTTRYRHRRTTYVYGRGHYYPYYGYGYGYTAYYGGPSTAEVVVARPTPQPRVGVGVHLGQLAIAGAVADTAGLAVRYRGALLEGELELGRRSYDNGYVERSLAATAYLNVGYRDAFHGFLLAGLGRLDSDRSFGTVGAGLAAPVAPRLTIIGDLRASSISGDDPAREQPSGAFEGRLGLLVDF